MFIAKQFDIIIGVDTHIVMIPTPGGPVPTPLPHPFIGIVFDPITFVPIVGSSIWANGLPRGLGGTKVKNAVPHIPMGGPFQKPPMNEGEIQMGNLTIIAEWQFCSFSGMPAYTCQDVGKTAPQKKHSKGAKTKGLVLPTSILLAIPKGGPIGAGGPAAEGEGKGSNQSLNGVKTPNGVTVTGMTTHATERAAERGVTTTAIRDALENPLQIKNVVTDNLGRESQRFVGATATVAVNPVTGAIVSVNPTSSSLAAKLLLGL